MKQKKIRYSQALEEVGDVFLLVATVSFLEVKLDFLKRKHKWMSDHNHDYKYRLNELISILETMKKNLESKLEKNALTNEFSYGFGLNMQKIRKEKNMTIEELSAKSYFNVEELEIIERGQYHFTDLHDLDHIAKILNSSLRALAGN